LQRIGRRRLIRINVLGKSPVPRNHTMGRVIAKAWSDAAFKARLLAEPVAALAQLDIAIPPEIAIVAPRTRTAPCIW
jgi:Nitrile hydratase, alpha chain